MTTSPRSTPVARLIAPGLCLLALAIPGCYERVVEARGIGTDGVAVQRSYRSDTALDRAVFPDSKSNDKGFSSSTLPSNAPRSPSSPN